MVLHNYALRKSSSTSVIGIVNSFRRLHFHINFEKRNNCVLTVHAACVASILSDASHFSWTNAFSRQRITGSICACQVFVNASILGNESSIWYIWKKGTCKRIWIKLTYMSRKKAVFCWESTNLIGSLTDFLHSQSDCKFA